MCSEPLTAAEPQCERGKIVDVEEIEKRLREHFPAVEEWIQHRAGEVCFPVYSSFDLRDAGFKVAVVDANVFPAGFNNLCDAFLERGAQLLRDFLRDSYDNVERVVIYPESHTRNKYYLQNLLALKTMLERAGREAIIATADPKFAQPVTELESADGQLVEIHKLCREGDVLRSDDFVPDLILINNDFSDGRPQELINPRQPQTPPPEMGWYVRKKWEHFRNYDLLVKEFADILGIDPWLLSPATEFEDNVDFKEGTGMERMAEKADHLLERIAAKYREYGIDREPLLFIKDNSGTYGMGIIVISSGQDLMTLNRSQRNKMSRRKGSAGIQAVMIQECIPTAEYYNGRAGEPVVYMMGDQVIGGFFRYSETKSETESLNSPGTQFAALCLTDVEEFNNLLTCHHGHCSFDLYYTISRISCLAMGREMKDRELCPAEKSPGRDRG
jgi:glutamate--cysteine ligase